MTFGVMMKIMKIAIIGFGREGKSLLKFMRRRREFRGAEIWILDENKNTNVPRDVRARLGKNYLSGLRDFDLVFRSPGVPYMLPTLVRARWNGVPLSSLTALFFEYCPSKII